MVCKISEISRTLGFQQIKQYSWTREAEPDRPSTPFGSLLVLFLFIRSQLPNLLKNFHFTRQIFFGIQWSQLIRHSCLSFSGVRNYTQEEPCLAVNSTQSMPKLVNCGEGLASWVCFCTSGQNENPLSAEVLSEALVTACSVVSSGDVIRVSSPLPTSWVSLACCTSRNATKRVLQYFNINKSLDIFSFNSG